MVRGLKVQGREVLGSGFKGSEVEAIPPLNGKTGGFIRKQMNERRTPNIERPTLNIEHRSSGIGHWVTRGWQSRPTDGGMTMGYRRASMEIRCSPAVSFSSLIGLSVYPRDGFAIRGYSTRLSPKSHPTSVKFQSGL